MDAKAQCDAEHMTQTLSVLAPPVGVFDRVHGVVKGGIKEASAEVVKKIVE